MVNAKEVRELIKERSNLHVNDPSVERYWSAITEELSTNVEDTIKFLSTCSSNEIYWISEVFEDISYKLQSKRLIEFFELLQQKFPNVDLTVDIEFAKKMIE